MLARSAWARSCLIRDVVVDEADVHAFGDNYIHLPKAGDAVIANTRDLTRACPSVARARLAYEACTVKALVGARNGRLQLRKGEPKRSSGGLTLRLSRDEAVTTP